MIKLQEIQIKSREAGVRDQQIEKDYVLSWLLQGISNHNYLSSKLVFKGGTVLKKVYFEDYRFSEDLDFTLLESHVPNEQILEWFAEVFVHIHEEANIPLEIIDNNEHERGGINFYISFIGPLGGFGSNKKVKVDITRGEQLQFNAINQKALLSYSDQMEHELHCYTLEEVLIEKLRSVMQRMQARDFYDIWYLTEVHGMNAALYSAEFKTKCLNKGMRSEDFHSKLLQRLPQYRGRWSTSLRDQIKDLPEFDRVEREALRHLKKLQ